MTIRIPHFVRLALGTAVAVGALSVLSGTAMASARPDTVVPIGGGNLFPNSCTYGPGDFGYAQDGDVVFQQEGQTDPGYPSTITAPSTYAGSTQATSYCVQDPSTGVFYELSEQSDGNLVIYVGDGTDHVLWSSASYTGPVNGVGTELKLQPDGNLVQYQETGGVQGRALWATATYPKGSDFACFENTGDLVVYDGTPTDAANPCYGPVIWESANS